MTTLIEIPSVTVVHYPTPSATPLPLASGNLVLALVPPTATHPAETVTLTVGTTSFQLAQGSPVQKVESVPTPNTHVPYAFSPATTEGGVSVGQVRINFKESTTPGEYQATEALARAFETLLKSHNVWSDAIFSDATTGINTHNWGETAATAMMGVATSLATKITSFTESNVTTIPQASNRKPPVEAVASAYQANIKTAQFAETAEAKVNQLGAYIHEGGKKVGNVLPESIKPHLKDTPEEEKGDMRKVAEEGWSQLTSAAKGFATAATTIGTAVSESTHRAVEHTFGSEADKVARDLGQAGANVAGVGVSAVKATSVVVQGGNAATGLSAGAQGQNPDTGAAAGAGVTAAQIEPGYHGKPVQVFSDEKQKELLKTAMS